MEEKILGRRQFLKIGATVAAAGVLAACTPAAPQIVKETVQVEKVVKETVIVKEAAAQPVEIEWWPGWPGNYMLAIAKTFEDANPDIKLKVVSNYPEKQAVLAAVAADTTPALIADIPYMELIVRDVFLAIDDYLATIPDVGPTGGDIRDELWNVFQWEGKFYGVPSVDTAGRQGMGINTRMAEEAGLDWNNPPRSWDDAFAWHQKMTTYDAAGNLLTLGFDPMAERTNATSDGDPFMWPHMWGYKYIDNNVFDMDRAETVEYLEVIRKFAQDVGVEKISGLNTAFSGTSRGPFGQGKVGMRITYPSGPKGVYTVNPKDKYVFTWVPMPANRASVTMQTAGGHAGMIMAATKFPDQAFKLAVHLTGNQACDILFKDVGWIGPRKSWQQQMNQTAFPEHVMDSINWFTGSMDNADEVWWNTDPIEGITGDEWGRVFQAVQFGDMTPAQGAKELQEKLQAEIDQMMEAR